MEEKKKPTWGVTASISEAPPTAADNKLNEELVETLTLQNTFETVEGNTRRKEVLAHVQNVVEEFVRRAGHLKGIAQSTLDVAGGKIFFFGSYALGVHGPKSDIDTLIVVPKFVFMEDFFKVFPTTFRDLSNADDITELVPVEDAFVPIIKMEYRGVSLDLLFASMPTMSSVSKDMITVDRAVLRHLDETTIRSVNGTRVVKELLASVPQPRSFRYALRAIKLWANNRAIYGAVFGYPGGIAWAIMVARICQLYPMACGATILAKFFNLMHKWNWPRPVMLKEHELPEFGLRVWNPAVRLETLRLWTTTNFHQIYPPDSRHLMPVITPAFPAMCSTHTITPSTKQIMMEEFQRADGIVRDVYSGVTTWDALFKRHSFFTKDHKYYLSVIAASRTKEADMTFHGLVQSRVRILVQGIDDGLTGIEVARPYTSGIERVHRCKDEDQVEAVTKGSLNYMIPASEVPEPGTTEDHIIYTMTFYIGLRLPAEKTALDISFITEQFRRKVLDSGLYNEETMSVKVVHTRK
ncbi:Poly(A) polymerase central domain-containing protein [Phaeosphaeria sp. MPI-PUGE-AT-0046c]|nr:Poly(A) polymerase central domain-containing protein [Phaeosphaeria sp. MPI-PUGE-AT-0046c]